MSLDYIFTSLIVILLPGTGVLYTLACGLNGGVRGSILAAVGCTLGILPHLAASVVGLAALLHTSALAFEIVKYLGVAYLFYMAWRVARNTESLEVNENAPRLSATRTIATGFLLNILNPKLSLFFLAFLPQFVAVDSTNQTMAMIGLALIFMALTFVVFIGYGLFAAFTRRQIVSRPGVTFWLRRSFAAAFGLMGLRLALGGR
ncbi:threonine/homoserine/homoserine lactone efflux protein [Pararhizobium capsulatum DSM 1112]|uniref:Threonine/homoserine/homoserine lactone efflux protein n=1 Tax=Pararhizobium capsulatum DSM 1112 TaxID=1121113 RepID=A0ABU0BK02_9HYPH|nr:LysE family translocator [Pararhizobium capsulatum]MDQ0318584.1 threonine/homoserine/homoserine lactone efflux protein [Pararhizobium capsulatum DSM 1112]